MPVNVVRTPEEEIAWERAKARAREEYPDASGERFYRIVMAIYKKMAHYQPRRPSACEEISMNKGLVRSMDRRGSGRTRARQSPKSKSSAIRRFAIDAARCIREKLAARPRLAREVIDKAPWVTCPGCAQTAAGEYHGRVLIAVGDSATSRPFRPGSPTSRTRAVYTARAASSRDQPGWEDLEILTTSQKLAHRIAREVEKAFGGSSHFSWSDDDGSLLAAVKIAQSFRKRRNRDEHLGCRLRGTREMCFRHEFFDARDANPGCIERRFRGGLRCQR